MPLRVNPWVELRVADRAHPVGWEAAASTEPTLRAPLAPCGTRVRGRVCPDAHAWEFRGAVPRHVPGPVEAVRVRPEAGPGPAERRGAWSEP